MAQRNRWIELSCRTDSILPLCLHARLTENIDIPCETYADRKALDLHLDSSLFVWNNKMWHENTGVTFSSDCSAIDMLRNQPS